MNLGLLKFQFCFMLANCRHEILSGYDTPQEAMRHQRTETEVSDTSQDILGIGKSLIFVNFLNYSGSEFQILEPSISQKPR